MPEESQEPASFTPYECSLGTVTGVDGDAYIISTFDGRVIGVWANGEPTAENVESDIASPRQPEPEVPSPVSPKQIRLALNAAGLRASVESAVASAPQSVQDTWEYATSIERNDPVLSAMAAALELTSAQVDDLFRAASSY